MDITGYIHIKLAFVVSGFGVGTLVGMTGVGGGSLMTPLLVLLFGITAGTAVGTDLLFASITKTIGTLVHGANHTVDWRIVGLLASGSLPSSVVTLYLLSYSGLSSRHSSTVIATVLGVALILTAISLLFRGAIVAWAQRRVGKLSPSRTSILTAAMGVVLGIVVSLSSVGAGAIGVTALIVLYPKLPTVRIVGSDIAHAVPLTLVAGIGHWLIGTIDFSLLLSLLIGSIPGIIIGSHFSSRVPERVLRTLLAVTLLLVGGKLLN